MTSQFLCPNCSLSVEAGSDLFGAECACPECAQVFVVPYPNAIPAVSEEWERMVAEKVSLQVALDEARKTQGLAEVEVKRLMFEAEGVGGKWEAERAAAKKRCEELERDLDGVRKEFKQMEGFAKQNQALVQERNRLQDRIQELNVQQKAQQPVPESWGYTGGQNQRIESGGGGSFVGAFALLLVGGVLGIACGLGGAPFVSQKYPKLAALVRFWNRDLPVVVASKNAEELPSEGLSLSTPLDSKENATPPAAPLEPQISQLPDAFQGMVLGGSLSGAAVGTGKGQWKEMNGRLHRKVELLGQGVEAVLVPDAQGRLVMGAYVRICSKQIPELTPFLEWAVSVQDSLSAQWGPPSDIHQISGVEDPAEVVEKVSRGEDFYQAIWEREGQDTQVVLSIRSWNERSVAFRLEYKSLSLTRQYVQKEPPSGVEPPK